MTSTPLAAPRAGAAAPAPHDCGGGTAHAHEHGPPQVPPSAGASDQARRSARAPASLLRLSAGARLTGAALIAGGLWLAVIWALR